MPLTQGHENTLLTDDVIAAEALRLLKNNLIAARYCFRDYEKRFQGKIGDQISIKLPFRVKSNTGRVMSTIQPLVDQSITLTVDQQRHVGLKYTMNDRTLSLKQFSDRYLKSAVVQLAHQVDLHIFNTARKGFFFGSGTPGTAVETDTFNDAHAYMEMVGVPFDGDVCAFVNPLDRAAVEKDLKTLFHERLVGDAVRKAYMGNLSDMPLMSTAQVPTHIVGDHGGTPLVNGASQTGASLVTDGWTASADVLNMGDQFTIAGVFEVNPQTYESTGRLQRFTVTSDATADGTGNATLGISPAINDGSNTTLDGEGASVSLRGYQNVTAAPADNAAITVVGTASTGYRQALLWHKNAVALAVVPLVLPQTAGVAKRVSDEESGLSIMMTGDYNINELEETYRLDVLWGAKVIYPELGHKIWSGTNAS